MKGSGLLSSIVVTLSKLMSGLIVSKYIAIKYGAAEIGIYSQLYSVVWLVTLFAGGGINNSLIRFVSSTDDRNEKGQYLVAGLTITVIFSMLTAVGLYIVQPLLNDLFVVSGINMAPVLYFLCFIQFAYALSNYFQYSVIAAERNKLSALIHSVGTFLGILVFSLLSYKGGFEYVLIGYLFIPAMYVIPGCYSFIKCYKSTLHGVSLQFNKFKDMLVFTLVSFSGVLSIPLAQIYFRDLISKTDGWEVIGYWQAVTRVSDLYFLFFTTVVMMLFFPKFAKNDGNDLKAIVRSCVKFLSPFYFLYAGIFLFFGYWLIIILYDQTLLPALDFVPYQVAGDLLKSLALIAGYVLLSKHKASTNILFQLLLFVLFSAFASFFIDSGVKGMLYAYIFTYIVYLTGLALYVFKK